MRKNRQIIFLFILTCFFLYQYAPVKGSEELTLTDTIVIKSGRSLTYENKVIYYDSSVSPVFYCSGSLTLKDCQVIPMGDSVDLVHTFFGSVYMENVTMVNSVFDNNAELIVADDSGITLIDSSFTGFTGFDVQNHDDVYISSCIFNVTEKIILQNTNNLTVTGNNFNLMTNESTNLFEVRYSEKCTVSGNNFTLPLSTAQDLGAWLVAVEFRASKNIIFSENNVRNAGKVFVTQECTGVGIRDNAFGNDAYVNSELQIAGGCKDVLIKDNTMWNLHDSIEVYDHENITIVGNHITTDVLGFYIKPSNKTAQTRVYIRNNTQIGGSVSAQYTRGLIIDGNTFIDTVPVHLINSTDTFFTNNRLFNSSIINWNTVNTTIDGNEVIIEPGFVWLRNDNSSALVGSNTFHYSDETPPVISNVRIDESAPYVGETISIIAEVTAQVEIQEVNLHYSENNSPWIITEMSKVTGDTYSIDIGPYENPVNVSIYISASDTSYNTNTGINDNEGKHYTIRITEPIQEPEPETEPEQDTTEPTQEPVTSPEKGIPGHPLESIILGLFITILALQKISGKTRHNISFFGID